VTGSEIMPMTGIPSSWSYLGVVIGFVLLGVTSLTTLYEAVSTSRNPLKIRTAPSEIIEGSAA
jgi:TRAP-type C4-dicarboxylate transport system permease small subunit